MAALLCSTSTSLCGDITVSDSFLVSNIKEKCPRKGNSLVNVGLKFHTLKLGPLFHRTKQRKTMRCSLVSMKGSEFSVSMKTLKSSSDVTTVLKSLPDTASAFSYFKEVALRVDGRIEEMGYVFDLMQKRIIKRDATTFLTVFKCLSVKGGLRQAPYALRKMREYGFVLNAYSYNGLIHLLLKSRFCTEAMEVYRSMISDGFRPSLQTYSSLMVGLGKRRDTEAVMGLLQEMETLGLKPNVYTFTICIRVLGRAGKINEAYDILERMDEQGCGPDVVTYTVLIDALCTARKLDCA